MPNDSNKILRYNHGEKSARAPFVIYDDLECLLEKCIPVKIILKNLTQRKKLSIHLLVTHCLQIVHLMKQKTNSTVKKTKTVWKGFVKKKISLIKSKRFVTYAKKNVVLIKMIKMHLNYTIKSDIIVITPENLEELFIVFAIFKIQNTKRNFNSIS